MIKEIECDIFKSGADIICHQVNCQGKMGNGIAKQVREKYPEVYSDYVIFCQTYPKEKLLGQCFLVVTKNDGPLIANLFGQSNYGYDGKLYTNYDALRTSLEKLVKWIRPNTTIAFPYKMSCDRGGGDWNIVLNMIKEIFDKENFNILICKYNGN